MIKKLHFKTLLLLCAMIMGIGSAWADTVTTIATATFDGKNGNYTEGWTTTGTGLSRNDCIIIGANENITSPAFDLSEYSSISITFTGRRYGSLTGSKATVDASIGGSSVGTIDITKSSVGAVDGSITFTPTSSMTDAVLVFTCTNATSAGSTHGAGIGSITITGTKASTSNATLTGITLSGDYEMTFPQNGTFSYEGLIVTASYDDGTSNAVTNYDVSEPDMTTLGTQTVTVSYTEKEVTKTATYDITIEEVQDYATLPFSWAGGSSADLKKENGVSVYCDGSDYSSTNTPYLVKFSKNGHYVMVKTDSQPGKVTVGVKMLGGSDATSITVQGSANGETFTDVETLTISGAKNDILNLETSNVFATTDRYVRLYFNKGSGSNVGVGPITIAVPSTDPAIVASNVELEADATSGEIAYSIVNPVAGTSLTAASEAEWISDFVVAADKVTFTTTANTGEERTATVTLTYGTLTKDVTVTQAAYVDPNAPGTENNPYTVAQAIAATPSSGTTGDVYISGIVSSFYKDNIISDGSNYRYYISDDGTTTTQLLVYKGKGMNNVAFSDADDLLVGDEVVICGKLTMYQNAPEVASGNYLVSLNRPASTTPSITVDPASVSVDAAEHEGDLNFTYENLPVTSTSDFEIRYCDGEDVEIPEPDWIDAFVAEQIDGEGYMVHYRITENEGDARTACFKVFAYDSEGVPVYSNLVTITQAAYVAPEETIGTFVKVTSTDDITSGQYLIVYEDGSVAFDGSLETLDAVSNTIDVVINDGTIAATTTNAQSVFNIDVTAGTLQSASGYYIGVKSNDNGLKSSEDAEAYTNSFTIDDNGDAVISAVFEGSTMTLRFNKASNQARFRYYKSGQQAIQLYKFVADADDVEVTVTSAGYATYCSENALDFSDTGLTAYKAILDGSEVSFTEVKQVPAGEGVLLKGDAGTYSVPVAASAAALTGNAFIGVIEETLVSEPGIFVLMNEEKGVGFYKTLNAFTVGAHTAYLPALPDGSRSFIGLNETTGISDVNRETITNNRYFDLQGRSVAQPTKGLYIVNGKKVVVK